MTDQALTIDKQAAPAKPWRAAMRRRFRKFLAFFQGNPPGIIGTTLLTLVVVACLAAPLITEYSPSKRVARPHEAPSAEHVLGSTRAGRDVLSQALYGGRTSLAIGLSVGIIAMALAIGLGIAAGYFGGKVDEWLSFVFNVFLVIPQVPLLIVLAAFMGNVGPVGITILLGLTSWAWGARVIRSQTMAIRNREYILSAEVMGESKWRILIIEILPSMISIAFGGFIGTVVFAIATEATLSFLGLSNPLAVTWGTMLYNAQQAGALYVGAWWDMLVPAVALSVTGGALALINMSIDQISNPKLKTGPHLKVWRRMKQAADRRRGLA